ncbi:MAG: hypothetical protein JHC26_12090 [Thermofilum sp.]|jgi:DNA-binding MarR family transcriptional regulator/energy-coupling factor transporter ATP-binding protein EcfA2|uniref:hypothetical protein n=1 Tax=Thermofilum sp. TaxID=1961369 RepID=UPI00258AFA38|nr:hypothetical protein [Thermofilum sp.]MCI4409825.1 hypothetical protein [Thermofilum sp.]
MEVNENKKKYLWDSQTVSSVKHDSENVTVNVEPKSTTMTPVNETVGGQLLVSEKVVGKDKRYSVRVDVYKIGEDEWIEGEYIVKRSKLKFVLSYANVKAECESNCEDAVKIIASSTNYNVPKKLLVSKISELRKTLTKEERINLVDYVRNKFAIKIEMIEKDPFKWVLEKTSYIVGYERLKILTFLSIVSSRLDRVAGMSRLHILFVGRSGSGKSTTVKSVLRFLTDTDIVIYGTRFTQNALGYLNIDSFDNRVVFLEQIDNQNINYLREMMTEDRVCTLVTEKVVDENGNEKLESKMKCVPGQAVVISTSVIDNIDVYREQLFNRFLKVYVNPNSVGMERIIEAIWDRKSTDVSKEERLAFLAYLLSRPRVVNVGDLKEKALQFLSRLMDVTNEPLTRITEILRNLVASVASARGKTKADDDDFQFVINNFQFDIIYNGLGLSERDIEIINAIPDFDSLKTSEIAEKLKLGKQYVLNLLKDLERKGVVESEMPNGKTYIWSLTDLGRKIKGLVRELDSKPVELSVTENVKSNSNVEPEPVTQNTGTDSEIINVSELRVEVDKKVVEIRDKKGEIVGLFDVKFRKGNDTGGGRGDAVPVNDGGGVPESEGKAEAHVSPCEAISVVEWKYEFELTDFLKSCLRDARCYIDRTTEKPVIKFLKREDIEVLGWVKLSEDGELISCGVNAVKGDLNYFVFNGKFYTPGTYYLVRHNGEELLIDEQALRSEINVLESGTGKSKNGEASPELMGESNVMSKEELEKVINIIKSGDYEIDGYVKFVPPMEPVVYGIDPKEVQFDFGGSSFIYKGKKYPPGVYDRVVSNGQEYLVPHDLLVKI